MLDIVQFNRWNEPMGIPDWVFMMGKSSVQNTVGMISFMPTTILISKVCSAEGRPRLSGEFYLFRAGGGGGTGGLARGIRPPPPAY